MEYEISMEKAGVGPKFKRVEECKTSLKIHGICRRLGLACGDLGDGLAFVNSLETTILGLSPGSVCSPVYNVSPRADLNGLC